MSNVPNQDEIQVTVTPTPGAEPKVSVLLRAATHASLRDSEATAVAVKAAAETLRNPAIRKMTQVLPLDADGNLVTDGAALFSPQTTVYGFGRKVELQGT